MNYSNNDVLSYQEFSELIKDGSIIRINADEHACLTLLQDIRKESNFIVTRLDLDFVSDSDKIYLISVPLLTKGAIKSSIK